MPTKTPRNPQTVDDEREPITAPDSEATAAPEPAPLTPELQRLIASNIVVYSGGKVEWRTGHLEHIARRFAADPMQTERDYHDDVSVAVSHSKELFEALQMEATSQ